MSAWKPKEKELTPEEAVEKAKEALYPYWIGVSPLLGAVREASGKVTAHPLDGAINERPWVIFFLDPFTFGGESTLDMISEFHSRFARFEISFLAVLPGHYPFLKNKRGLESLREQRGINFGLAIDHDGLLSEAFAVKGFPKAALVEKGKTVFEIQGQDLMAKVEPEIHLFLRRNDPGLPLLPFYTPGGEARDASSWSFSGEGMSRIKRGDVVLKGKWEEKKECIRTSDPNATIQFICDYPRFSVLARSATMVAEPARLSIEAGDNALIDTFMGKDVILEDTGRTVIEVRHGRLYHAVVSLPKNRKDITLSFPQSNRVAINIYGILFSST